MICDCGNNIDLDQNSFINIMLRFLSQNALWAGCQQLLIIFDNAKFPVDLKFDNR
jgi:hypothetical protein